MGGRRGGSAAGGGGPGGGPRARWRRAPAAAAARWGARGGAGRAPAAAAPRPLAAQHGHLDIVRLLLDAGEDPSRYNPEGNHGHSTPLHQAVISGRSEIVRLLVERGARLDIRDTIYNGTPLGWAEYCNQPEIAA